MSERYDQAINYWGQSWGSRNNVVVAINGSFYNTQTASPVGGQIHSGWYAKRFDNVGGGSGFAWQLSGNAFIGRCVTHMPYRQIIHNSRTGEDVYFDGVNIHRSEDDLIIFTPQYDSNTGTNDEGLERGPGSGSRGGEGGVRETVS